MRRALAAFALLGLLCGGCSSSGGDESVADARDTSALDLPADVPVAGDADALPADVPSVDAPPVVPEVQRPGPFGVGVRTLDLVDPTRPTPSSGEYPGAATRTLTTEVWYPAPAGTGTPEKPARDAAFEPASEPQPLLVYLHGFMSSRNENAHAAALLASRGFVVAAVDGPLTNLTAPDGANPADVLNIPGDARFVADQVIAQGVAEAADGWRIDEDRLGIVGVSLGSLAALLTAFRDEYRDPRLKIAAVVAPPGCYLPEGFFDFHSMPVFVFHGTLDAVLPYQVHALPLFEAAPTPKWLVLAKDGTHAGIAGTAASLADHFENADLVSCHSLSNNENATGEKLAALAEQAGGGTVAEILERCGRPCPGEGELPPALGALRQVAILERALVAFVLGTLGNQPAFLDYLENDLPAECPEATVQSNR